jgi:hypothetical protein
MEQYSIHHRPANDAWIGINCTAIRKSGPQVLFALLISQKNYIKVSLHFSSEDSIKIK